MAPASLPRRYGGVGAVLAVGLGFLAADASAESVAPKSRVVAPFDFTRFPQPRPMRNRPGLPVRVVPYKLIEPNRDVAAHIWQSPYCVRWDDGVETCARDQDRVDRPARCGPMERAADAPPERMTIVCRKIDIEALFLVCNRDAVIRTSDSDFTINESRGQYFRYRPLQSRWDFGPGSGQYIMGRGRAPKTLAHLVQALTMQNGNGRMTYAFIRVEEAHVCLEPYTVFDVRSDDGEDTAASQSWEK